MNFNNFIVFTILLIMSPLPKLNNNFTLIIWIMSEIIAATFVFDVDIITRVWPDFCESTCCYLFHTSDQNNFKISKKNFFVLESCDATAELVLMWRQSQRQPIEFEMIWLSIWEIIFKPEKWISVLRKIKSNQSFMLK
jgi:hypothetical protein